MPRVFVVGYSFFITQRLKQRLNLRLDEVQLAHQGFANSRGWVSLQQSFLCD